MAAVNGTLMFKGISGRIYSIDLYAPDAVATETTFNNSGKATSSSKGYWSTPEAGQIIDISMNGAPTATGAVFTEDGGNKNNYVIRWANQSNALATRVKLAVPVRAGVQLGLLQF